MAVALLAVPVIGASVATPTFAAAASHTISQSVGVVTSIQWVMVSEDSGCENLTLKSNGKFVAATDGTLNHGIWATPNHSKIVLKWTGGPATGFVFKGTYNTSTGVYHGHLLIPNTPTQQAELIPTSFAGC